jgi:hypothetical protein
MSPVPSGSARDRAQPGIATVAAAFGRYPAAPTVLTCAELAPTQSGSPTAGPLPSGDLTDSVLKEEHQ